MLQDYWWIKFNNLILHLCLCIYIYLFMHIKWKIKSLLSDVFALIENDAIYTPLLMWFYGIYWHGKFILDVWRPGGVGL